MSQRIVLSLHKFVAAVLSDIKTAISCPVASNIIVTELLLSDCKELISSHCPTAHDTFASCIFLQQSTGPQSKSTYCIL